MEIREEILQEAAKLITGDRQEAYGSPQKSFSTLASLWNTYLSSSLKTSIRMTEIDVAVCLALLKIGRMANSPKKIDSYVDLAGYAALAGELAETSSQLEKSLDRSLEELSKSLEENLEEDLKKKQEQEEFFKKIYVIQCDDTVENLNKSIAQWQGKGMATEDLVSLREKVLEHEREKLKREEEKQVHMFDDPNFVGVDLFTRESRNPEDREEEKEEK